MKHAFSLLPFLLHLFGTQLPLADQWKSVKPLSRICASLTHMCVHVWQTNQGRTQTIMLHSATRGHTLHREHWTNNTSTSSCSQPWAFRYYKNRKMDLNNLKKKIINWLVVWWAISHTQRNELEIWLAQFNIHIFSHMSKDLRWK